jgi:hypothetical protein
MVYLAQIHTGDKMSETLNLQNLKRSIIAFLVIFSVLYLFSFVIDSGYSSIITKIGQNYYENNINNDRSVNKNIKLVNPESNPNNVEASITYYGKRDASGNFIVKTIGTDLRRETLISVIFFTALVFSFPFGFKRNLLKFAVGIIILYLLLFFKLYIFIFDNYNYPEYAINELPAITSFFVYWGSYFFNVTGASTNVIFPVMIWMLVNIKQLTFKTSIQ